MSEQVKAPLPKRARVAGYKHGEYVGAASAAVVGYGVGFGQGFAAGIAEAFEEKPEATTPQVAALETPQ